MLWESFYFSIKQFKQHLVLLNGRQLFPGKVSFREIFNRVP